MPFRVGTNRIGRLVVGDAALPPPPASGLIGWYDASDYTSGTTWIDKSVNGNDITLSGTYSKDTSTMGGGSVFLNTGAGTSNTVSDWSATTEITHIEILRTATPLGSFKSTWGLDIGGTGAEPSGFQLSGTGRIETWIGGNTGYYLTTQAYNTGYNQFVARRLQSGFDPATGTLKISYGDSNATGLTQYGSGDFNLSRGGSTTYTTTASDRMIIGQAGQLTAYRQAGYYAVNLFYNRLLSDAEIQTIYDYYSSTYNLV